MEQQPPGCTPPRAPQTGSRTPWIYLKPNSWLLCDVCETGTELGPVEVYINPDYLNRLRYVCSCGAVFTVEHFEHAGAERVDGMRRTT